jgi:hypothetical protein
MLANMSTSSTNLGVIPISITSITDSYGNALVALPLSTVDYNAGGGNIACLASRIWYIIACSNATTFSIVLAGGQPSGIHPQGFYNLCYMSLSIFELSPLLLDTYANNTFADPTGRTLTGPALAGTGTTDFYILGFGYIGNSNSTVSGWTTIEAEGSGGPNSMNCGAYRIGSGTFTPSISNSVRPDAVPVAEACFLDNPATLLPQPLIVFVNLP